MSGDFPVIVMGASAGGVEALKLIVSGLPKDLPAAVLVVLHLAPGGPSVLPQILARHTDLAVVVAEDGQQLSPGTLYVGRPNRHLELHERTVRLTQHPPQDHHRPSIDRLFLSAATSVGTRAIGVVLSGCLDDGTLGLAAIVRNGGSALVQDPDTADYPDMPASALLAVPAAVRLPIDELAAALVLLCAGTAVTPSG
ncbi:MAG: two-component system, chemotaxis family, protein-glutamate methylesterase/glutaminase [Frankiales bacterium]|nr:two-component system, chemotaxis family, protein-glutamate methylesterase/glutaminase [Frankiales bacterium]